MSKTKQYSKQIPDYLRLHVEEAPQPVTPARGPFFRAFLEATGWEVWLDKSATADNQYQLEPAVGVPRLSEHEARLLCDVWFTAEQTALEVENALASREAELATAVPVISRSDEARQLAKRLQAVLAAACQSCGADSSGLYVLDDATSELKLRAGFNLPTESLLGESRPLRGALAELEALVGHAVVIEDGDHLDLWNPPQPCQAAVCLPVSTASTPLGVMWVFSHTPREFTADTVNMLEVITGRLAAELEREVLIKAAAEKVPAQDSAVLEAWRANAQTTLPDVEQWEIAVQKNDDSGTRGHHVFAYGGRRHSMLGLVQPVGPFGENLLAATLAQSAFNILAEQELDPIALSQRIETTLWQSSPLCPATNFACLKIDDLRPVISAYVTDGGCIVGNSGGIAEVWADEPRLLELELDEASPLVFTLVRHDRVNPEDVATSLTATLRNGAELPAKALAAALQNCLSLRLGDRSEEVGPLVVLRRR